MPMGCMRYFRHGTPASPAARMFCSIAAIRASRSASPRRMLGQNASTFNASTSIVSPKPARRR
jgi:hypothetical protein